MRGAISDYDGTLSRKVATMIRGLDGNQPGDVKKGVKVIVDVLMDKFDMGIPPRLVLGSDGHASVVGKCNETVALLEKWRDMTTKTDIET